jgi:hypothetical protein
MPYFIYFILFMVLVQLTQEDLIGTDFVLEDDKDKLRTLRYTLEAIILVFISFFLYI